jgi:NitT/TauT family transport system substrate-binding protein
MKLHRWLWPACLLFNFLRVCSAEPIKVTFVTDWYPQAEHGGFYQALLKGYFKQQGLDVQILPGGPNVFAVQRVASKAADFAMADSTEIMLANERGIPVVAIGATMQHDPQGIMLHEDDPVKDWADLEGRSIDVTPGAAWFRYLVKRFHFKAVKEVPLTYSVGNFLRDPRHVQQCFITSEPFVVEKSGGKARVMLISSTGYDPYRVFFTRREMVDKKPEVVRAFTTACIQGWTEYLKDPALVHARLKTLNPEMTPEKLDFSHNALKQGKFIEGDAAKGEAVGRLAPGRWQAQFEILKDIGALKGTFNLAEVFTTTFSNPSP